MKYRHVINIGIQNTLVYRVNFLFRATFGLVPLTAMIMLWRTVYGSKGDSGNVGAYALPEMISYYLLVTVVNTLTAVTEDDWQIAADIKDGLISQFLLKPIDYLWYRVCLFISGRLVYTLVAAVPVLFFVLYHRESFLFPKTAETFGFFLLSLVLTGMLQFLLSFTMALLSFWVMEVATFIFIMFAFEYLAGGQLFPLDILPPILTSILELTPFPYLLYFPIGVYLGKITGMALVKGLGIQFFWVTAIYCLARWVWGRGIKHYSAAGG